MWCVHTLLASTLHRYRLKRRRSEEGTHNEKGVIGAWFLTIETSNTSTVYLKSCNGDAHGYVISMPFVVYLYMGLNHDWHILYTYGVRSRCSFQ